MGCRDMSPGSCHMSHVGCHMSHVTFLLSRVSWLKSHDSCLMSHGSCLTFHVSHLMSRVTCLVSRVSCHARVSTFCSFVRSAPLTYLLRSRMHLSTSSCPRLTWMLGHRRKSKERNKLAKRACAGKSRHASESCHQRRRN